MNRLLLAAVAVLTMGVAGAPARPPIAPNEPAAGRGVATPEAIRAIQTRLDKIDDDAAEARQEQREVEDLAAQKDMATFAERQFWVSIAGAIIAAVSVGFTFTALWQTNRSLGLAQHTARAELRPYLGVASFDMGKFNTEPKPTFRWTIRNYGATAAMAVEVRMGLKLVDGIPDTHTFANDDLCEAFSTQDILPGGEGGVTAAWPHPIDDAIRTQILDGEKSFVFALEIRFRDAFDAHHVMRHAEVRWGRPNLQPNHFLRWDVSEV